MSPARTSLVLAAACVGAATAVPTSALAQSVGSGDASAGKVVTERWCSSCHVEDPKTADTVLPEIPPFIEIAARRDWTPEQLLGVLADPHEPMPQLSLTRAQIADVVAYLRSLSP